MSLLPTIGRRLGLRHLGSVVGLAALVATASVLIAQQPTLPTPVSPDQPTDRQGRQVSLRDQLRVGLKAVTKADLAFIDLVVLKVNQGKLPRSLVDSTFLWARNRYKTRPGSHRLRPMVYFQPALVLRAKGVGVLL